MNKKRLIAVGVVALAIIAVGAIIYATNQNQASKQEDLAAIVNGVPISLEDFEAKLADMEESSEQYSANDKSERTQELMELTINQMIDTELTRQLAEQSGVTISDDEVAEQYDMVVDAVGDEAQLADMLAEQGMTDAQFREQIRTQLLTQAYINAEIGEPEVTDAEVQADYDANKDSYTDEEGNVMSFDEVAEQIHDMLLSEKQTEELNAKIDEFRDKSTIAIFVLDETSTDDSAESASNE